MKKNTKIISLILIIGAVIVASLITWLKVGLSCIDILGLWSLVVFFILTVIMHATGCDMFV